MTAQALERQAVRWSLDGQRRGDIGPHGDGITTLVSLPGQRFATGSEDAMVRVFERDGTLAHQIGP